MSQLALFLLGPPRLELDGVPLEVNRRKAMALLAYLALTGQSHSRDALAALLWPDYDQTRARAALRRTLSVLHQLLGPWLVIERERVSLPSKDGLWLDVHHFQHLLNTSHMSLQPGTDPDSVRLASLTEAVTLYRADFLAGFTLRDSPDFDEWQFFQSESLRQALAGALEQLVECHWARQEFEPAIGYARRWLSLDPLHEPAHRRLMELYARTDQRAAALRQYGECVRLLKQELGLSPSAETTALYERIQMGEPDRRTKPSGSNGQSRIPKPSSQALPGLSQSETPGWSAEQAEGQVFSLASLPAYVAPSPEPNQPVFVARERELAHMHHFLDLALTGQGQVVLVVGEVGSGKTALVQEFARQAQAKYQELIFAVGHCNAHTGLGDPYLPFREILELLTCTIETKWTPGLLSSENAQRLWTFLPASLQTLLTHGPNLIDTLVPNAALVQRATSFSPAPNGPNLGEIFQERRGTDPPAQFNPADLSGQFINVLQGLAKQQPLLLVLEDMQWADVASLSLLFHVGRRLEGSPILLVLTYRPDDVALGQRGERHPLEPVLNELKRRYGNVEIDLNQAMDQAFIEALLDSQPNRLGADFRAALYQRTQGHPLFTIELLRDMQERGDIVRDEQGYWVEGQTLNWEKLPVRVEAVIEERLGRLEAELREILTVASVEGKEFTAQVIARVQKLPERQLLRFLSQELEKRHHLLRELGEIRLADQRLSRYQFVHGLFQHYLYHQLSTGERRLLHGEIATTLEEFYSEQTEEITVQLARHYAEAGQNEKAVTYLLAAGDRARNLSAYQEAIGLYQQALAFLKEQGATGREPAARTLMKLGLTYHLAFDFPQARRSYDEGFTLWQWAMERQPALLPAGPHPLRLANSCDPLTLDPTLAEDSSSISVIDQLFSGLVELTPELDVAPEIARNWEVLEGGRTYIFHLRDDVIWNDGAPVTAEDFVYAWRRTLQPLTKSPVAELLYDIKGAKAFYEGKITDPAYLGVRALDPVTLLVELESPTNYFPHLLANSATYPLPRHVIERQGQTWADGEGMVTNGPFNLKTWQPGEKMTFARNPDYKGRFAGNVSEVELNLSSDYAAHLQMYETDKVDVLYLWDQQPFEKDRARQRYAGEYVVSPGLHITYICFDMNRPPFHDVRVRRAFTLAIDREMLAGVILGGYHSPALGGFVPPGIPGHSPEIGLPYNPDLARRLLAEAGYPAGQNFPKVDWLAKPTHTLVAEYLQAQWRENLGIDLQWKAMPWGQLLERLDQQPSHIFHMGWMADYLDSDNFLRISFHKNGTEWHNETYEALIEQARQVTDPSQRLKLHQQADKILVEEAALIPLTYKRQHLLIKPWVSKFPISALKMWYWKEVIIEPH